MDEVKIIGKWEFKNGQIIADENCKRIQNLIENKLTKVQTSEDGWTVTYKSEDGSLWELTYPEGHLNGGGPPTLSKAKK